MRFNHLHEVNFALVSGTLIRKGLFNRTNGKKGVTFAIENVQFQRWGKEIVQFKNVVLCLAFGEIARLVWVNLNKGDRVFVQGSISWKGVEKEPDPNTGKTPGVQSVLVSDIIRMKGEDFRMPTWEAKLDGLPNYPATQPSNPVVPRPKPSPDQADPNTERKP